MRLPYVCATRLAIPIVILAALVYGTPTSSHSIAQAPYHRDFDALSSPVYDCLLLIIWHVVKDPSTKTRTAERRSVNQFQQPELASSTSRSPERKIEKSVNNPPPAVSPKEYHYSIRGRIVGTNGRPIAGATIFLDPLRGSDQAFGSRSDESGNFHLEETTRVHRRQRRLFVAAPRPPGTVELIAPPFNLLPRFTERRFAGAPVTVRANANIDLGEVPVQIRYGIVDVQINNSDREPSLATAEQWRHLYFRLRNKTNRVVTDTTLSQSDILRAVNLSKRTVAIALIEGTWWVEVSADGFDGPWKLSTGPIVVRPGERNLISADPVSVGGPGKDLYQQNRNPVAPRYKIGRQYRTVASQTVPSPPTLVLQVSVNSSSFNRASMLALADRLRRDFPKEVRLDAILFSDYRTAKVFTARDDAQLATIRGGYYLDRTTGEEQIDFVPDANRPNDVIKIDLTRKP